MTISTGLKIPCQLVLARIALILFAIHSASCGGREPKVLKPVPEVKIVVVDYLGDPVPDLPVKVERPAQGRNWGSSSVAAGSTDSRGRVEFRDVLEDDEASAVTVDRRFGGSVRLAPSKSEYILKLDYFGIGAETKGSRISSEKYFSDTNKASETINKIVAHYVKQGDREFYSLEHYVNKGVISKEESARFLRLRPLMVVAEESINFCWADERLVIHGYNQPITWEPY